MTRRPAIYTSRRLRQESNAPEDTAWQTLRKLRQYGYPVRRQHPVGGYVADFAIPKAQLLIEIDGAIHLRNAIAARDADRQRDLEAMGWTVARFTAEEALEADIVWKRITDLLAL